MNATSSNSQEGLNILGMKTNDKHRIPFDWMGGRWINGQMDSRTLSDNEISCTRLTMFLKEVLMRFRVNSKRKMIDREEENLENSRVAEKSPTGT